jgi:DNA polymerase-1
MKVTILDGYNLIHRARHSTPKWVRDSPQGIVFTFFRSLRPLIEKFEADKVYFVVEGMPKWRLEVFPDYKGTRPQDDDALFHEQKNIIIDLLASYFPIIVTKHPDFECDDVIGYLAEKLHEEDECTVVSSDTDFIQLLNRCNNVKLYNPIKKSFIENTEYDYVAWKALAGDSSDNIDGFRGIGKKRAIGLLEDENKLKEFLDKSSERKEKFDRNIFLINFHDLSNHSEEIIFSRTNANWDTIKEKFENFKFESILKEKTWTKFVDTFSNLSGVN